jgi:hypothetical protein
VNRASAALPVGNQSGHPANTEETSEQRVLSDTTSHGTTLAIPARK